jgi:hypothetical protein
LYESEEEAVRSPDVLPLLAACATLTAGCGSTADRSESTAATSPAHAQTTTPRSAPRGPLGAVRQRLAAAGFYAETNAVSGAALGSLLVGDVTIYAYHSASDATADMRGIEQAFAEHPDRGLVKRIGARLYMIAAQRSLTASDRARFAKVIAVGEASGR